MYVLPNIPCRRNTTLSAFIVLDNVSPPQKASKPEAYTCCTSQYFYKCYRDLDRQYAALGKKYSKVSPCAWTLLAQRYFRVGFGFFNIYICRILRRSWTGSWAFVSEAQCNREQKFNYELLLLLLDFRQRLLIFCWILYKGFWIPRFDTPKGF